MSSLNQSKADLILRTDALATQLASSSAVLSVWFADVPDITLFQKEIDAVKAFSPVLEHAMYNLILSQTLLQYQTAVFSSVTIGTDFGTGTNFLQTRILP
jgi:hypothetical protein